MKELKTIHELCVNIVDKEMEKKAMTGEGFTLEEKKAIATSLNLLWTKTELKFGLKFILRCLDEEWELDAESSRNVLGSHQKASIILLPIYCYIAMGIKHSNNLKELVGLNYLR